MPEYQYRIIGNMWKKTTKDGKVFLSGNLKDPVAADVPIFMWPNENKRPDKQDPDWTISRKNDE